MTTLTSITPLASASRSASGVSSALDLGVDTTAALELSVAAFVGTSLDVYLETAKSATAVTWERVGAFLQVSAAATEEKVFADLQRYVRVGWTLTGTATFGVSGSSVRVYSAPRDMRRVIADRAFFRDEAVDWTNEELDGFAQDATDEANGSLGAMFTLPLTAWGRDVRRKTAEMAVYYAMMNRGYSPDDSAGKAYRMMFDDAQKWLGLVRDQKIELQGVTDSTPDIEDGGAYIVTDVGRGWGTR